MSEANAGELLAVAVAPSSPRPVPPRAPRVKPIDRRQTLLRAVDVERLVEEDHAVRAIWELVGRLDLTAFYAAIAAVAGVAGQSAWDPRLLISLWLYAYSQGIGSAREVARRCAYDPAFQWLTGLQEVNYHTLADFRVSYNQALDELFAQALGLLSAEGLITLQRVMHDGTKIKASAGSDSFRREERLRAHLEQARQQVAALADPHAQTASRRQQAARRRAARERQQRLEQALSELERIRQGQKEPPAKPEPRVSLTDPTARIMKQADGGYAPSYNVQLSSDAAHDLIVGVGVSQCGSDYDQLLPAMDRVVEQAGQAPAQAVVDGGFTNRENVLKMAARGIDLVGPSDEHPSQSAGQLRRRGVDAAFYPQAFRYEVTEDSYRCPAGHSLSRHRQQHRLGVVQIQYRAARQTCLACEFRDRCCPQNPTQGRTIVRAVEEPPVTAFRTKMRTEQAQQIYRQRGQMAEFPNAWLKAKIGLRQFHLRGLAKVLTECLWACLTYNIQQWIRLRWRSAPAVTA
jgi:transposase